MFARTVVLVQIAAIIACPMWCGNGVCHAGQCDSAELCHQACPDNETARCCLDQSSPDSNRDCPTESPDESSCQGVCGGAIFEKPSGLNNVSGSFLMPHAAAELPGACPLAECRTDGRDQLLHCGTNHGRSLRTLHMSFLC